MLFLLICEEKENYLFDRLTRRSNNQNRFVIYNRTRTIRIGNQKSASTHIKFETYNPEARRLANTQGEIRVGPSHQAKLPLLKVSSSLSSTDTDDFCSLREELVWKNRTSDLDLSMYLQAARSIAAFAGMCDRGLAEDMYEVAQRDDTTINALTILHNHDYDCKSAIQALVKCPIAKGIDRKWSEDDQKKFLKGIRQYGKNFFRIRKDLLPHKQTSDIVEYYYLWKKTPQAQSSRPRRRQRPCSTSVQLSTTPPTSVKQRHSTKTNLKDESEHNSDNDDNQTTTTTTDLDDQYCRHCQNSTKDLQLAGRENHLLCHDCRMYYRKHGEFPSINVESSMYLFKPLNESSSSRRKRTRTVPSPDENSSLFTRSRKRNRVNEKLTSIKRELEEEEEDEQSIGKQEIKLEEQENEKPSLVSSSLHMKIEDANSSILTPTPCKQEFNSSTSIFSTNSTKILNDHSKRNHSSLLLSSPSSAFSRTSRNSLLSQDSLAKLNNTSNGTSSDDADDESTSDVSANGDQDEGVAPLRCEREFYNKSQGIVLLRVYDRSMSENSCARTDIVLKRGSRLRSKPTEQQQQQPSTPTMTNIKQEERTSSRISFPLDKGPPLLHPSASLPSLFPHLDPMMTNRNGSLFHPSPLHAPAAGMKPSLGFPPPYALSPHDNMALRHLDPLGLRWMNPSAAQLFAAQSSFATNMGRQTPAGLDPATAAFLLDPRYRSMIQPFPSPSSPSIIPPPPPPPPPSSSSSNNNGTHNHAHVHSHSHTHLHLGNGNDSSASNTTNGPSVPLPPPPPLLPLPNPLSGLSHGNSSLHTSGPLHPGSLEAINNLTRERDLMALFFASNNRFDPMPFALNNSLPMSRYDDFSRMNARERSAREHQENEFRRLAFEAERQQLRFPFHHPSEELLRRY